MEMAKNRAKVAQCDASVSWDEGNTKSCSREYRKCRIGVCDIHSMTYHVITLDDQEISQMFYQAGFQSQGSRQSAIIFYVEARAIALAHSLYPDRVIESDCQKAVVTAKALMPDLDVHWVLRSETRLADKAAKEIPDGTGVILMAERVERHWLKFEPSDPR